MSFLAKDCTMGRVQDDDSWPLNCELRILEAKNVELKHSSELFVRCYLSAGKNTRVPINTQEISAKSNTLHWDECFSLECFGDNNNFIETLRQEKVVFELRQRSTTRSVFKLRRSSNLVGTAEVAWKTVLESGDMKMEQWFPLALKDAAVAEGFKPPMIRVAMKIQVLTMKEGQKESSRRLRSWDECGCKYGGCCCIDDDLLLVLGGSMFEALSRTIL